MVSLISCFIDLCSSFEIEGKSTRFEDFSVRPVQLTYGPTDGEIAHDPNDGFIPTHSSDVNLADVVVEAEFFNPLSTSEGNWSYGFLIRNSSSNTTHFVFVRGTGDWYHILSTGSVDTRQPLRQEVSWYIDTSQTGSNHLRLIALGDSGWLFINDTFIAELDLSGLSDAGDVEVIGSYFQGDEVAGRSVVFEDFAVWSLE